MIGTNYLAKPSGDTVPGRTWRSDWLVLHPQGHPCFVLGNFVSLFGLGLGIPNRKPDLLRL